MRTLKLSTLGVLLITFTLLVTDVLDFCTAGEDGTITWDPHVSTAAVRKYGALAWHAIAPREVAIDEPPIAATGPVAMTRRADTR